VLKDHIKGTLMSIIKLKRSNTPGSAVTTLADGEVAINQADGVLFTRKTTGGIRRTNLDPVALKYELNLSRVDNTSDITKSLPGNPIGDKIAALSAGTGNNANINFRDKTFRITDYGAVGDGSNSTQAVNDALTALKGSASGGGTLAIPAGEFLYTGTAIDVSNKRVKVLGEGPGISRIVRTTDGNLIQANHTVSDDSATTHVAGLSLLAKGTRGGNSAAISCIYNSAYEFVVGPIIRDLDIRGYNYQDGNDSWKGGIILKNCVGGIIDHCHIAGGNQSTDKLVYGISLSGQTTDFAVRHNRIYFCTYGMYQQDFSEGVNYHQNYVLLCEYGLLAADGGASKAPGGYINSCHFNTKKFGVRIINRQQWKIQQSEFYKWTGETGRYIGIQAEGNTTLQVKDNLFVGFINNVPGGATCGVFANSPGTMVVGNSIMQCDYGFDFNDTSRGTVFLNNYSTMDTAKFIVGTAAVIEATYNYPM
jgi:hypothetical protein